MDGARSTHSAILVSVMPSANSESRLMTPSARTSDWTDSDRPPPGAAGLSSFGRLDLRSMRRELSGAFTARFASGLQTSGSAGEGSRSTVVGEEAIRSGADVNTICVSRSTFTRQLSPAKGAVAGLRVGLGQRGDVGVARRFVIGRVGRRGVADAWMRFP